MMELAGWMVHTLNTGKQAVFADVSFTSSKNWVGKYGVDVQAFETAVMDELKQRSDGWWLMDVWWSLICGRSTMMVVVMVMSHCKSSSGWWLVNSRLLVIVVVMVGNDCLASGLKWWSLTKLVAWSPSGKAHVQHLPSPPSPSPCPSPRPYHHHHYSHHHQLATTQPKWPHVTTAKHSMKKWWGWWWTPTWS